MRKLVAITALIFTGLVALQAAPAAAQGAGVVGTADLDRALAARQASAQASRDSIKALLARDDVRAFAAGMGVEVRRASAAVDTLDDAELAGVAAQAAAVSDALAGGQTLRISLVAALLIVIILILLLK
jgi:hypothetical protein